jgi:hypothetical protein
MYKQIITFLYHNYAGVYSFRLFGRYWTTVKASRGMFPFMVIWGVSKLLQPELYFSWWDAAFTILAIIQYLAGFTNLVVNEYKKLNKS